MKWNDVVLIIQLDTRSRFPQDGFVVVTDLLGFLILYVPYSKWIICDDEQFITIITNHNLQNYTTNV